MPAPSSNDPRLTLARPGARTQLWAFLLAAVLPLAITAVSLAFAVARGGHLQLLGGSLPLTMATALGAATAAGLLLWGLLAWAMRRRSVHVERQSLAVRAAFYRCRVPLADLDLDQARIVDLDEHTELRPGRWSGNNLTLPGLRAGWFTVGGRGRAFVAITGGQRVLWLPSRRRPPTDAARDLVRRLVPVLDRTPGVMLEPCDPAALLAHLRELAGPQARR